jgi:hypothetical protein
MAKELAKFEDWPFKVPHIKPIIKKASALTAEFKAAKSNEEALKVFKKMSRYEDKVGDEFTHVSVLYSLDTTNKDYEKAMNILNEGGPLVSAAQQEFTKAVLASPYRPYLEEKLGKFLFTMYEYSSSRASMRRSSRKPPKRTNSSCSMKRRSLPAKSNSAGAPITCRRWANSCRTRSGDPQRSVQGLLWLPRDPQRRTRRHLRQTRQGAGQMAKKLGYKSFTELAYIRMNRFDYTPRWSQRLPRADPRSGDPVSQQADA